MKKFLVAITSAAFAGLSLLFSFQSDGAKADEAKLIRTIDAREAAFELNSLFSNDSILRFQNLPAVKGGSEIDLLVSNLSKYLASGPKDIYYDTLEREKYLEFFKANYGAGKNGVAFLAVSDDLSFSTLKTDVPIFFFSVLDTFPFLQSNSGDEVYFWSKKYSKGTGEGESVNIETLRFSSRLSDLPVEFQDLIFKREAEIAVFLNPRFEF